MRIKEQETRLTLQEHDDDDDDVDDDVNKFTCRTQNTVLYLGKDVPVILFGQQIDFFSESYRKYINILCT